MNKSYLSKDVQDWLDERVKKGYPKKNLYHCDTCQKEIVTIDSDNGVTPFMLLCRATPRCNGMMTSSFYKCNQSLVATFEFYRPETIKGLDRATQEHVKQGGLLLRPMTGEML
jgi:hypothetical protein